MRIPTITWIPGNLLLPYERKFLNLNNRMKPHMILRAANFAARKHRLQKRKDEESSPYVNHPLAVAMLLAEVGAVTDEEVLAAAILHDTLEDTETTPAELEAAFGARVRALVEAVTDDKKLRKT